MTPPDLEDLRLDLAPKLNRPLSLWNPLDYLRLLFWVFYFPQALRWYVDTFGGGYINPYEAYKVLTTNNMSTRIAMHKGQEILRTNSVQRKLLVQAIFLAVTTPAIVSLVLKHYGVAIAWDGVIAGMAIGPLLSVTVSPLFGVAVGVAYGVAVSVASGVALVVVADVVAGDMAVGLTVGMAAGTALCLAMGITRSVSGGLPDSTAIFMTGGMTGGIAGGVTGGIAGGMAGGIAGGMAGGIIGGVAAGTVVTLRLDSWLMAILLGASNGKRQLTPVASVTPLPFPSIYRSLRETLRKDWSLGVHNCNQLLAYTCQFVPVLQVVNQELNSIPAEQLFLNLSQLCRLPFDWRLIQFSSASLWNLWDGVHTPPRLNTPARAAAAGFWYLHENQPDKAAQAFAVVRDIPHGEEMHGLASLLVMFAAADTAEAMAAIELPDLPSDRSLRPHTWEAIRRFCNVISDTKTVQGSASRSARAFATNRALGELQHILDYQEDLPEAERALVVGIAKTWQAALLEITAEVGEIQLTQPVRNPYVVGDPVEGERFVGRDDIMRQLQELWLMGQHLQSVVIYGHRRMGKTSILKNAAQILGANVKVAYVNLLKYAWAETTVDVLTAITDQVARVMELPSPADAEMVAKPELTFERFLQRAIQSLGQEEGLIIAIDEFEKIEELIKAGKLNPNFMAYLRGLLQDSPQLAFAFAGLHTLEEMTADYFQPFFSSVISIKVDFFKPDTVRTLLPNPGGDFPLDYDASALDAIYRLTAGQPYLTQLLGFFLVRRYNDQVFERHQTRDPVFTAADVQAVVGQSAFFAQGKQYFMGVWSQASNNNGPSGQQTILQTLAPHANGLSLDSLQGQTGLNATEFDAALTTLKNHDVVRCTQDTAQIIVELFRRWIGLTHKAT